MPGLPASAQKFVFRQAGLPLQRSLSGQYYLERKNGLPFFDYDRDEISFFHFNVSGSEMASLRLSTGRPIKGEKEGGSDFNLFFLKKNKIDWGAFSAKGGVAVLPSD